MTAISNQTSSSPVFSGIYPMLYAFYDKRGGLDREAIRAQVRFCLASGAHGIACLGLGTEVSALSTSERLDVMAWAAEDIAGEIPLAVTITGRTINEQIAQAKAAEDCGAKWLVLQPPFDSKPSEIELTDFFSHVMSQISLPVGIQNAPDYLGIGLSAAAVAELAQRHENFRVMKGEGPVCHIRKYIEATKGAVAIFNGRGGLELPDNLRAGCAGMVPASDTVDFQVRIYNDFVSGRVDEAYEAYQKLLPLIVFTMQTLDTFWCYGKLLAARRIGISEPVTSRTTQMTPDAFGLASLNRYFNAVNPSQKGGR
jgi:2-keto-3-deoxy-L-arabinonate dehydratase